MKSKKIFSLLAAIMLIGFSTTAQETFTEKTSKSLEVKEIKTNLPFHKEPVRVTVEVVDDQVFLEGDILLGNRGDVFAQQSIAIDAPNVRWPNGTLPYSIEPGHPQRDVILRAVDHLNKTTNLNIIPRTNEVDYVHVINSTGCWSYVGRRGGKQSLSVTPRCSFGSTIHEFCHAAGLWHEQSRCDRDQHVSINFNNITDGKEHNFKKHCSDGTDIGPYDYESLMHYPDWAFSKNGQPTIVAKNGAKIGQRAGMSNGDINGINTIYPKATPPNPNPNPNPNPPGPQLDPVEIYMARQYKGVKMELGEGMHDFKKISSKGIRGIRSIKIPDGYKVTAYTGNAGGGQMKVFKKSINYIGMPYRSVKIEVDQSAAPSAAPPQAKPAKSAANQLTLFVGKDGKGKSVQLKPGNYSLDDLRQKGVTVFRSVQLPEGYKARVFTGAKFNGKSRVLDKSMNLNSPARSIKIVKE